MVKITVRPKSSLRVEFAPGELELIGEDGQPIDLTGKPAISLCRCGGSTNKPFRKVRSTRRCTAWKIAACWRRNGRKRETGREAKFYRLTRERAGAARNRNRELAPPGRSRRADPAGLSEGGAE